MKRLYKSSFTLLELLIVVAILAVIGAVALILFNPWYQFAKAQDTERKSDLATFKKAMENYYNDKECYPKPDEVCYDDPVTVCQSGAGSPENKDAESQICHVCGNETEPGSFASFAPYMSKLPCDPQQPNNKYLYEVPSVTGKDCLTEEDITSTCPQWYRIYSQLSIKTDTVTQEAGCYGGGCGLAPYTVYDEVISPYPYGYDYGATSSNEKLKRTNVFWGLDNTYACNNCGTYDQCNNDPRYTSIYPGMVACCSISPKPAGCP